jgi:HupE / UreJ protein
MKKLIFLFALLSCAALFAHPMPNSVIALDVRSESITCELQLPLKELQFALPFDVTKNTDDLLKNHQHELSKYILSHFNIQGTNGEKWRMTIKKIGLAEAEQTATGLYQELTVTILIQPNANDDIRTFTINYDAIVHQVINHRILVTVRQDWENGQLGGDNPEIGTISIDIDSNKVHPFKVNLAKGSNWKGFKSMVNLGIEHISEGTDHLLFLLVLLLSAPLLSNGKKWAQTGGTKYSLIRILKITFAFTIGHSITLLIGTFGLLEIPSKFIEIVIAISVLVTAIHAVTPIFANKEIYIASGFGLIHGLAFATILSDLHLGTSKLALSLLGFNLGIELMQLFVILIIMPWLLLLSPYKIYKWIRVIGALLAGILSIAWAIERYTEKPNFISIHLETLPNYSIMIISGFACFTIFYIAGRKTIRKKV